MVQEISLSVHNLQKPCRGRVCVCSVVSSKARKQPAKLNALRKEAMLRAVEAAKGGMGVYQAAKEFGVQCSSLRDHLSGRVIYSINPGPNLCLACKEEGELALYLTTTAKAVCGKTIDGKS